jgi:O-antigen ligase
VTNAVDSADDGVVAWNRAWGSAADRDSADRWVEPFAVFVLMLALLYTVLGGLGDDTSDPTQTNHVNPLNSWIWLGLFAMSMPVLMQRWREAAALARGSWALLLLLGYFGLSVSWALDPGTSMRRFIFTLVQLILFIGLLSGIRRAPQVHMAIVVVCACAAAADLATWVVAPGYAMTDEGFAGLQSQKNQTGLLMMYGCLAAVPAIFLLRRRLWKCVLAGAAVMMAALLVATRSTTSQSVVISAAVVMPVLLLIGRLPRRAILAVAAVFGVLLIAVPFAYLAWCGATGADPLLPLRGATFTGRTDIWSFVVGEITKRPWFGAGYSSFWSIDPAVQPSLRTDGWFGVDVIINEGHDGYLDQLATGGVAGLAGSLFVLFRGIALAARAVGSAAPASEAWREGKLARPTAAFYLALLLGLIVHNATESNLFSNNGLLAVALLLSLLDLEKWRLESQKGLRQDNSAVAERWVRARKAEIA